MTFGTNRSDRTHFPKRKQPIESIPGVSGGEPCIAGTRIPVWVLVQARLLGASEAELLRAYPTLRAEDLANAWAYYHAFGEEIDRQIRENEAAEG